MRLAWPFSSTRCPPSKQPASHSAANAATHFNTLQVLHTLTPSMRASQSSICCLLRLGLRLWLSRHSSVVSSVPSPSTCTLPPSITRSATKLWAPAICSEMRSLRQHVDACPIQGLAGRLQHSQDSLPAV